MPSSYGAYPHIHGGSAKEQRRSNQKPDTLMQDASARVDETSCTARPDHLSAGPLHWGQNPNPRTLAELPPRQCIGTFSLAVRSAYEIDASPPPGP
jgi:hypothetical protein